MSGRETTMQRRTLLLVAALAVLALGASACASGTTYMSVGVSAGYWGPGPAVGIGWTGRPF
jgi:hypothetical protein